jgi:hypothetical protein
MSFDVNLCQVWEFLLFYFVVRGHLLVCDFGAVGMESAELVIHRVDTFHNLS